jgi:transposase
VLQQQFLQGPGTPPAQRPTGRDVIETPHEVEVREAVKRGRAHVGDKMQVTETCDQDQPHLIMDLEPTGALDNDSPPLSSIQERLQARGALPGGQRVDQGYMSGENLVRSAERGINLLGASLDDTQGPPGFKQRAFQIDLASRQATCLAGQRSRVWSEKETDQGPPIILIRFAARACQTCPSFGQCTTSRQGRS